jgi:hypothetical protein
MRSAFVLLVALFALVSVDARAADSADDLINSGTSRMEAGDYAGALSLYRRANEIQPSPRGMAQVGLAEQALERWIEAEDHLSQALVARTDEWITKRRRILEQALRVVQGHLAHLLVEGGPNGAEVLVDGEVIGLLPFPRPRRVVVGKRKLEVRAVGFLPASRTVDLASGATVRERMELQPTAPRPAVNLPAESSETPRFVTPTVVDETGPWRGAGLASVALGGVSTGVGGVLIWLHGRCAEGRSKIPCNSSYGTRPVGIALVGGGLALMAGGVAVLHLPGWGRPAVAVTPTGLVVAGNF